ncbi:MAG: peptide-methionine (S)-S-oxide reductase MsrA [Bacteroidia bacterium]|nr:peptide-methionine (S)-S-oxide reductase MsrA [Bacteroidia bacterium]MBT8274669.1 peptide-methionine (S)-S-oxide reductase MsrA [Bacteroidia bacterium]NNF29788.1 peptide-methionine (S)-S-oxide reductase MsrA [Flavobacteriaceae bacterium]NNK55405.1 peptide-methionine (S)-S-oxide reductase MsrA [Flavobacteriaceae bacterium]NNM09972.1 peptide-methionine (S)-S-oxide reductase MsrA [Flavobacteriaceae bacterium]
MEEKREIIVLAAGCFWCTEAVFQRFEGIIEVKSGYTGGHIKNPAYREVCSGRTGHAEGVQLTFDPEKISFKTILEVFFATHDPTTLNRQGNDVGSQYRSGIFYSSEDQRQESEDFIEFLEKERIFNDKIVTEITPLDVFYEAEVNHQEYYNLNKNQPYCQFIITPKIDKIKKFYSDKLKANGVL